MARKSLLYTVTDEGRDKGKVFLLTEMAASQAERWAVRAFLAMAKGGVELPDGAVESGFAGLASYGITLIGKLPFEDADVLMDEMFQCITIIPNAANPNITRGLVESDIEEIGTRIKLRVAVFKLHADFSKAAAPSTPGPASAA
jgi:hypothetical protein